MSKLKIFITNFIVIILEIAALGYIAYNLHLIFLLYVISIGIVIFFIRFIMFRIYVLYNLTKYLITLKEDGCNILKFSLFTRLWYLDNHYLKGIVILPISRNANRIVCSTSVHYQPLGHKYTRPAFYFILELYDKFFSGLIGAHPISWELKNTLLSKNTNMTALVTRHKKYRLVKSMLLKIVYSDGTEEFQKDYMDELIKWNQEMESLYGRQ